MGGVLLGDHGGYGRRQTPGAGRSAYGPTSGPGGAQAALAKLRSQAQNRTGGGGGSASPGNINLTAQTNPGLQALSNRYTQHLDDYRGNDSHTLDLIGQKIRDAREGGAQALETSEGLRGIRSSNQRSNYEAQTQGLVASGLADAGVAREANYGQALQAGVGVYGAPAELALREKGLNLGAAQEARISQAQQFDQRRAAANDEFEQFLRTLQMQQAAANPPIFTGY